MLVVWRNGRSFGGRSSVSTWIMGIGYRKALKLLAASRRWTDRFSGAAFDELIERSDALAEQSDDRDLRDLLDAALRHLSAEHRAVVELTYFYGCSYEEIAAIAACPVNTVKTRMFHARAKLKKLLPALGKDGAVTDSASLPHEPRVRAVAVARQRHADRCRTRGRRAACARVHRMPARAEGAAAAARRRARSTNRRRLGRSRLRPAQRRARRRDARGPAPLASPLRDGGSVRGRGSRRRGRARDLVVAHAVAHARRRRLLDARDSAGRCRACSTSSSRTTPRPPRCKSCSTTSAGRSSPDRASSAVTACASRATNRTASCSRLLAVDPRVRFAGPTLTEVQP